MRLHDSWYDFARIILRMTGAFAYHIRCTGRGNFPSEGGVLLVCNHQSHLDVPLVGPAAPRRMNFLARDTLFRFAPFGWLIRSLNAIPIDRAGGGFSGIKETLRRLKRGKAVLVFPEGTRTGNGEVGRFHPGFAALALRSGAAIVPAAIEGAFDAWPRGQKLPALGNVHVHYGAAILPAEIKRYQQRELVEEVERRVRQIHAQLRQRPIFARRRAARPA